EQPETVQARPGRRPRPAVGRRGRPAGGRAGSPSPPRADAADRSGRRAGRAAGRRRHRLPGVADRPLTLGGPGRHLGGRPSAAHQRPADRLRGRGRSGGAEGLRRLPLPALRRLRGGVRAHPDRRPGRWPAQDRRLPDVVHRRGVRPRGQRHGLRHRGRLRTALLPRPVRQLQPRLEQGPAARAWRAEHRPAAGLFPQLCGRSRADGLGRRHRRRRGRRRGHRHSHPVPRRRAAAAGRSHPRGPADQNRREGL
ncbi:MAG: Periplasmic thiol:disulfide interchange protein DsbA, partial [uncultured Friedmanniella sp.]